MSHHIQVITAPEQTVAQHKTVFLAGGITNCPLWQDWVIELFRDPQYNNQSLTLYNPRRRQFPTQDPEAPAYQIAWEHQRLMKADAIFFWFASGSLNPIVLYEYGRELGMQIAHRQCNLTEYQRPIAVGVDINYSRKFDVIEQTRHFNSPTNKSITIHNRLSDVVIDLHRQLLLQ